MQSAEPVLILKMKFDGYHLPWETIDGLCELIRTQWYETMYTPHRIVALGRGGMIPARILAGEKTPIFFHGVNSYHDQNQGALHIYQQTPPGIPFNEPETLIVDDLWDSGQTFKYAKEHWPNATYCALLSKIPAEDTFLDYVGLSLATQAWIHFPWE